MTEELVETSVEIEPAKWVDRSAATPRSNSTFTGSGLRFIRRAELRKIVPLADTTIYEMERRGEFPRRFYLTSRCVAWDIAEVEAWMRERRRAYYESLGKDLILSGPYLDENGDPIGSMIIMRAEDLTAAETFARADPFYLEHVFASLIIRRWDWFMNRPEGFVS